VAGESLESSWRISSVVAFRLHGVAHSEAAASIAPAPLNKPGLVISTETGYFHSMNLPQPVIISSARSQSNLHNLSHPLDQQQTDPNMHIVSRSSFPDTAPIPWSTAAPTAGDSRAIRGRHRRDSLHRRRVSGRYWSRRRRKGGSRSLR